MKELTANPMFPIALSLCVYEGFRILQKKSKIAALNPLLLSIAFIILFLNIFSIPLEDYNNGGAIISMFLAPATASLALSIYREFDLLKKHWFPILISCFVGAATSIASVYVLCRLFGFDEHLTVSLLPKSVTTPIAMEVSSQLSGIPSITVAAVVITGILGAVISPALIKIFKVTDPAAAGVSIGACSHAVGTSKAVELGEIEGAMSGISIGISGIITVILALVLFH